MKGGGFKGGGSTSQVRSRSFVEIWPEFAPTSKMALLTPRNRLLELLDERVILMPKVNMSNVLLLWSLQPYT